MIISPVDVFQLGLDKLKKKCLMVTVIATNN